MVAPTVLFFNLSYLILALRASILSLDLLISSSRSSLERVFMVLTLFCNC